MDASMDDPMDAMQAALAAIEAEFLASAERDLRILSAALADLRAGTGTRADHLARIGALAHDLKGQSGAFGFEALGAFAGSLDTYLRQGAPGDLPQILGGHCEALDRALAARAKGPLAARDTEALTQLSRLVADAATAA